MNSKRKMASGDLIPVEKRPCLRFRLVIGFPQIVLLCYTLLNPVEMIFEIPVEERRFGCLVVNPTT